MILDKNNDYVGSVQIYQTPRIMGTYDEPRRLANAALLKASWDMREALKTVETSLRDEGECPLLDLVRATIAKAAKPL